jgi:hypothetical protein
MIDCEPLVTKYVDQLLVLESSGILSRCIPSITSPDELPGQ